MAGIPYTFRVGALLLLAGVMVLHDRLYRQGRGGRVWEYGFLFLTGILGALYGAANDAVTSGMSPEYFTAGKGLSETGPLRQQAVVLGAQAGFSAGAIACAIWQFVLRRMPARERCLLILRHIWVPFVLALSLAVLFPLVCGHADPLRFAVRLDGTLSAADRPGFLTVWWVHLGTYSGLTAGMGAGIYMTKKHNHSQQVF